MGHGKLLRLSHCPFAIQDAFFSILLAPVKWFQTCSVRLQPDFVPAAAHAYEGFEPVLYTTRVAGM
jgi:hypothetical protein